MFMALSRGLATGLGLGCAVGAALAFAGWLGPPFGVLDLVLAVVLLVSAWRSAVGRGELGGRVLSAAWGFACASYAVRLIEPLSAGRSADAAAPWVLGGLLVVATVGLAASLLRVPDEVRAGASPLVFAPDPGPEAAKASAAQPENPTSVTTGIPAVAFFHHDNDLKYVALRNPPAGLTKAEALGKTDEDLFPPDEAARLFELKRGVLETGTALREEIRLTIKGEPAFYDLALAPRRDDAGAVVGIAGVMMEIQGRKRAEEVLLNVHDQLDAQVNDLHAQLDETRKALEAESRGRRWAEDEMKGLVDNDPLTGLPSRRVFADRLSMAVVHAHREKQTLAVIVLGLDGFRAINENLGRDVGDDLLRSVGAVLEQTLRQGDTIARLAGDEFTILLPTIKREEDVTVVAEKIRVSLRSPFSIGGHDLLVTASIGIALYPEDGPDTEALLRSAGTALRRAKERGGDAFAIHAPATSAVAAERMALENALRKALVQGDLALHYQPIVDCETGTIRGVEALLRWRNPDRRLVPAGEFIPVADATGLSVPLGQWALREACTQAKSWHDAGFPDVSMSVNLSGRQLEHPALLQLVKRALEETGLVPSRLSLEVAEADLLRKADHQEERIRQLKKLGVQIWIDDFGVGQSSLGQINRFPADVLKIDRAVIAGILNDRSAEAIATAGIALARSLKLKVVAEGVETEAQRIQLVRWQCDLMQGNLSGSPLPAAECEKLLSRQKGAVPGPAAR
jgi:diguanylate cyclase (GGDEF)-like protein/PAS domain S-box-containing protein